MDSPELRHTTSAMDQRLTQVLLNHMSRDSELLRDFPIALVVPVLQYHCSAAFRRQLIKHLAQSLDTVPLIKICTEGWELDQLLPYLRIVDVERRSLLVAMTGVFLGEVTRDGKQVRLRAPNCSDIRDPQHPQVHFLGEIRCVRLSAHASRQECPQYTPMLGEQSFQQRIFVSSHGLLDVENRQTSRSSNS
jgi:hypothetical protein